VAGDPLARIFHKNAGSGQKQPGTKNRQSMVCSRLLDSSHCETPDWKTLFEPRLFELVLMSKLYKKKIAKKTSASRSAGVTPVPSKKVRYVYSFGDGKADGNGSMKPLLGGKGAGLHEMTRIGLPVPPGFTITTEVCTYFYANRKQYPHELAAQVATALAKVEKSVGKKLGDRTNPLLVSVRSGARDSMPGVMDTILNLGMNDRCTNFLPNTEPQQRDLAKKLNVSFQRIAHRVEELREFNPMLGLRGCRLGIAYPEITEMKARAIFEAVAEVQKSGIKVKPEIMIPLVGFHREMSLQFEIVHRVAKEVAKKQNVKFKYLVGIMLEIPRGAIVADDLARGAEFFSFGTNDLTQTTLGMSRDDSGGFLPQYQELEILANNPFATIDQQGVGKLMEIARDQARKTRPDIELGICGEHGGDPESVKFCHRIGLDYVSCSPFRIPVARLAAAQAALEKSE
jgi:phosphoenolpyruvate synthase/pyruvate phosphate dikinase